VDRPLDDPRGVPPKKRVVLSPQVREALRVLLLSLRDQRRQRGDLTTAQLRFLRRLLVDAADVLYRLADRTERGERVRVPRGLLDDLADQAARVGPADDAVIARALAVIAELRREHRIRRRARRSPTAKELRAEAMRLMTQVDEVERAQRAPRVPGGRPSSTVGRPRNNFLDRIFEYATKKGIPDAELARALAAVDFIPDGPGSPHTRLDERWAAIIKSARARRRKTR